MINKEPYNPVSINVVWDHEDLELRLIIAINELMDTAISNGIHPNQLKRVGSWLHAKTSSVVKEDQDISDPCPDCGKQLRSGRNGGAVCSCGYWFCY
jgi:hypothetical protein